MTGHTNDEAISFSHVGRVGVLLFVLPAIDGSNDSIGAVPAPAFFYSKVMANLDADTRVRDLNPKPGEENGVSMTHISMGTRNENDGRVPAPNRHVHVAKFDSPVVMKVNVPRRLQGQDRGASAIPSEEYIVAWDGVELLVTWTPASTGNATGYYGGFAAIDVLRDALEKAGVKAVPQPCGPHCEYPFAHTNLLLSQAENVDDLSLTAHKPGSVVATIPTQSDDITMTRFLARRLGFTIRTFARMRGFGATVIATENRARKEVADLLMLQYEMANVSAQPFFKSISLRIEKSDVPKKMSRLIAGLWLRLATLEQNRRKWGEVRHIYETSTAASGFDLLFGVEYPQEVNSVEGIEVDNLRSAVEQMTVRADSRGVIVATITGAIAGGAIAGIVALVAALASVGGGTP